MKKEKPALVIMAAGMGSRYGGLKQMDPVDSQGDKIVDFSVYDAMRSGFGKVVFIIKEENLEDFREAVGDRIAKRFPVEYAFQSLQDIPGGFAVPEGRKKPWGTAQAVLSAEKVLKGPFAVINADDFYGEEAFRKMKEFLEETEDDSLFRYACVTFVLRNTLTENGSVARGICQVSPEGFLTGVTERTCIEEDGDRARFSEDGGETWNPLTGDEPVSMNFWGFTPSILPELKKAFTDFLSSLPEAKDPLKAECYLPFAVDSLIRSGRASAKVLHTHGRWFGVTYKEDKPAVTRALALLREEGKYPENLWD